MPRMPFFMVRVNVPWIGPPIMKKKSLMPMRCKVSATSSLPEMLAMIYPMVKWGLSTGFADLDRRFFHVRIDFVPTQACPLAQYVRRILPEQGRAFHLNLA